MTIERTPVEQQKREMVMVLRDAVRLKHRIAADRELNELLPHAELRFDVHIQRGELPDATDIDSIVKDVVGE